MKQEKKQPKETSLYSKDEESRLLALYHEYEQQKVILQYQEDIQNQIINKLNIPNKWK
tara:strand:- start:142 stop:315 length:174 start_codon:yes stop_codon:yes gene_type:complete